jgi:hypothetical protein
MFLSSCSFQNAMNNNPNIHLRRLFKYFSPLFSIIENRIINKYGKHKTSCPVVFIIGAPRSGSTILYQILTSFLDVQYINNFIDLARENINFGFLLNNRYLRKTSHKSYKSEYGKTNKEGLNAPNEGMFWYKWLPKDKHYVTSEDVSPKNKDILMKKVNAVINRYRKPFVIKNLSFSMRLDLLKEIFPEAKYIYIKRNPAETAMSVLKARLDNKIKKNKIWSILPKNYKEIERLEEKEMVISQIYHIEKQINIDSKKLTPDNFKIVYYEELCKNTLSVIDDLRYFIQPDLKWLKDKNLLTNAITPSTTKASKEITKLTSNFDWEYYYE